jgi:hypothetical protein
MEGVLFEVEGLGLGEKRFFVLRNEKMFFILSLLN